MINKKIISIIIFLLVITLYIFFISNKKITLQRSNQVKENLYKYKITNDYEKILNIKEEKNYIYVLSQKETQNNIEYKLIKYNLELSNIEKEVTFNTIKLEDVKLIFENDLIKVISKNNINIHTFDKNLKLISKIVKNIKSYDIYGEYNNKILYTKDNKIYINDKLYDEVLKTCNKATNIIYKDNSFIYFNNEELNIRCIYNINKKTTDYIDNYNVEIINDGYFLYNNDIVIKKDNEKKYYLDSKNELDNLKINNDGTKLLTFNKELKELKIYDLENNKIFNKISLELNSKEYILLQILNDLAYIVVTDGISYDLYIWDYNKNIINENMKERNISKIDSYELVNKIKNSFNVNVNIYDKGIRYFNDFYALPSNDIELTLDRLKETYEVLNYFNKDFFNKFNINDNLGIEIYLTGKVSPSNLETQISNPSAYSLVMNNTYIIALNINTKEYKKTLCHELMHTIENNMLDLYENKIIKNEPFNKWNTLNPKNFNYNNSYTDETNEEYTISNNKDIYFIDSYSKTYPSEDRARIFEQFCNSKNILNEYSNIKKKALYLKDEIIRVYPKIKDSSVFNKLYNMS